MGLSECYINSSSYSPRNGNNQASVYQQAEPEQVVQEKVAVSEVVSDQGNLPGVPTPIAMVSLAPEQMRIINDYLENQLLINKAILMLLIFFIMIKLCNR